MKIAAVFLACCVCLQAAPEAAHSNPEWPDLKEGIVIFKTHFDLGSTHRIKDLIPHYRTRMSDQAMDIIPIAIPYQYKP